jgi:hypothetical protein
VTKISLFVAVCAALALSACGGTDYTCADFCAAHNACTSASVTKVSSCATACADLGTMNATKSSGASDFAALISCAGDNTAQICDMGKTTVTTACDGPWVTYAFDFLSCVASSSAGCTAYNALTSHN